MRLTYLWIQQFGKLKEREIFLDDGINVIYGANESGKTTLHSFIRAMIFGLPRYRGRASKTDPYTRFEPWERPIDYAGSMNFEVGEKKFCIERNFYKNDTRESFVCETDGEELSLANGDLQMILGDISESVYDNTVSIGQLRSETDEGMVRELQRYMSNFEGTGSGDLDAQRAAERLKKKRKQWVEKRQEAVEKKENQHKQLQNQIDYIKDENVGLEHQLANIRQQKIGMQDDLKAAMEESRNTVLPKSDRESEGAGVESGIIGEEARDTDKENRRSGEAVGVLLGCLIVLLAAWDPFSASIVLRVLTAAAGCALMLASVVLLRRRKVADLQDPGELKNREKIVDLSEDERKRKDSRDLVMKLRESLSRLQGKEEALRQQLTEKETIAQNLMENLEELSEASSEIRECETEIQSLDLAIETLNQLSGVMCRRIGQRLQRRMEEILGEITEGKYSRIAMDDDMKITLYEWNRQVFLFQLSRGTVEQVYFALRMAVSEILCEERLPILLDDVFAMYDEKRLTQTIRWLAKRGGQVLIFTCHKRENEILKKIGIRAKEINLEEM
ncbi:MAG: hypothetical protein EOM40_06390 [Clostridia bacterium]|nr:hypothetical protein [Clostridia bacterium]NCC42228.1 hypothetical protein [Clostridia bacterium]